MKEKFFFKESEYNHNMGKYECCGNCRYWKTVFDYEWGICHIFSPNRDRRPSTRADESCAEFCYMISRF
jgi:hypothetical protein